MAKRPFIKALLIDISGNLHVGSKPTPGAIVAIQRLRQSKISFRLCSNASKESTSAVVAKLNAMGFDFESGSEPPLSGAIDVEHLSRKEVWTSVGSMAQFVRDQGFKRPYMLLSDSARREVFPDDDAESTSKTDAIYDAVVVGLSPGLFDYEHLNTAFRILKGEYDRTTAGSGSGTASPLPLIATHKAKFIEKDDPPGLSLGPGPFVSALEEAAGCKAHIVGKPTRTFFELVINDFMSSELGRSDGKIAVIGDDVEADLGGGAVDLGLWRVLVKTGKYRHADESRPGVVPPDEVHETFASFVDHLLLSQDNTHFNDARKYRENGRDRCVQM